MLPWRHLNWKGRLNYIFGSINLVCAFILAYEHDLWCIFNLTIAFFCFMANYLIINQKPDIDDRQE